MTKSKYWGYHAILDATGCNKDKITDPKYLKAFVESLVEKIEMVPYGEPQIVHFGHNEEHLAGWTVIQLIETSNIICHFCDHSGEGYIDVFSCKKFDHEVVRQFVSDWFNCSIIRLRSLKRQA